MAYLMSQILLCVILGIGTKRLACETSSVTPPSTYTEYNRSIAQAVGVKHDTHSISVLVKVLFKPRKQTISHTHAYLSTVLLMFDIEINPGPPIPKYPCGSCGRAVSNKQAAVSCDACDQWFHIKCQGMSQQTYNDNIGVDFSWTCSACTLSNIQVTLLNHTTSPTSTKSDPGCELPARPFITHSAE